MPFKPCEGIRTSAFDSLSDKGSFSPSRFLELSLVSRKNTFFCGGDRPFGTKETRCRVDNFRFRFFAKLDNPKNPFIAG